MIGKWKIAVVVLIAALVIAAWLSGGEQPVRMIEQPVAVPAAAR